jgi:hypothetical protein
MPHVARQTALQTFGFPLQSGHRGNCRDDGMLGSGWLNKWGWLLAVELCIATSVYAALTEKTSLWAISLVAAIAFFILGAARGRRE